jgi:hypothetical protein
MAYMKHPELGNEHVSEAEVEARKAAGWVQWPRSLSEKADNGFNAILREAMSIAAAHFPDPMDKPVRKKPGPKPRK